MVTPFSLCPPKLKFSICSSLVVDKNILCLSSLGVPGSQAAFWLFWVILTPLTRLYRSSLSTRAPGCTGLESGKKAAFTSRPLSVSAA